MNNMLVEKIIYSLFIYVGIFRIFKLLFEKVNGNITSKYLLIDALKKCIINPTKNEQKVVIFSEKSIHFIFWLIIWSAIYPVINKMSIKGQILEQNEVFILFWPATIFFIVIVYVVLISIFRDLIIKNESIKQ